MSVVVVGLNHRTVPLPVLESMTVAPSRLQKALDDLTCREHIGEVAVLSTCLRTEVYAVAARYHGAVSDARNFLAEWSGQPPESFSDHLYAYYDEAAASHLFKVASGLDSAVLGEGEVLGQVGEAWEAAHAAGAAGPVLALLFRHAQEVGKRVRSETAIARGTTSLSQAAVTMAKVRLGTLAQATTLVIGAGEMGEAMVQALAGQLDTGELLVANRTWTRATELAARSGGRAIDWEALPAAIARADLVLASTGSTSALLTAGDVEPLLPTRGGRPLLVVDIAVPRDIDPAVGDLPGVTLLDMDDVTAFASAAMAGRRAEVPKAEEIISEELGRYLDDANQRQVAPLVAALRDWAEDVRVAELGRFDRRLAGLDPEQRRALEALTRGLVAKLLHEPTVTVKASAGTVAGEQLAQALRQLFRL